MLKLNNEAAVKFTIQIVEKMIESTPSWINADTVIDSMEKIYTYFTSDNKPA